MTIEERLSRHLSRTPDTAGALFIAANATVQGDVVLGPQTSVFYGAVLRGDIHEIRVGEGTNIQDNAIVHLADDYGAYIGKWCTIGHAAIIHACTIGDEVVVGMGAIVMDGVVVGSQSIIGAGALLTHGLQVPPGSLVYGTPAKVTSQLGAKERSEIRYWAEKYCRVATGYMPMIS